ncbi:NAD-P-binding protein [Sistotremastrum niveocremeum HHB9708]|uniref:NAD-P-binding protein n=1 Tax=Sistotremastrum niveocremeum HHB9708 TaxID=1314777 RepID=A0A164MNG5_9AGAM|nr:NAD-P-binding protein [Sistotremastrum niveocremeum HHB9708]
MVPQHPSLSLSLSLFSLIYIELGLRLPKIFPSPSTTSIDPSPHYTSQSYAGKTILITGASRGIGSEIALFYARSGASLVLFSRKREALDDVREEILKDVKEAKGRLVTVVGDVTSIEDVRSVVERAVEVFGRIDVVVANAGKANEWVKPFVENDPEDWWRTVEVNVRGVYNVAHFAIPHLNKTSGYFVITSSITAQSRIAFASAYVLSKLAVGRLNEYMAREYPNIKTFAFHPGAIKTALSGENSFLAPRLIDSLQLPAATLLRLTSGREHWLSGRYVSSNWDLDEVNKDWKEKIIRSKALVSRLSIPAAEV